MTDIDKAIEEAKKEILPYESWERLTGESSSAFSAFCAFRDFGALNGKILTLTIKFIAGHGE